MPYRVDEHPSPEVLAAYASQAASAEERKAVERHLLVCPDCRRDWAEGVELSATRSRRRWLTVGIPVAAAAALAIAVLGPWNHAPEAGAGRVFRGEQREGTRSFPAIAPADGERVSLDTLVFRWHSEGDGAHYVLTVTDTNGDVVWTTNTSDTAVALPRTVALRPGERYYWYVDALLERAGSSTTGVREFLVIP